MQITDEMVEAAAERMGYNVNRNHLRAALRAALATREG